MEYNKILNLISILLLCISITFNFIKYSYSYTFIMINFTQEINIQPTLISTMISLLLFGGYIIRNINEIIIDYFKIIIYLLDLIFFSGFISIFVNQKTNIFGFSPQSVLLIMVILMLFGIRTFLRYIFLFFIACSFFFISKVNEAMGYYGAIYILSAFFSFAIQIYTNILPKVVFNEKEYFGIKKIQNDEENYYRNMDVQN